MTSQYRHRRSSTASNAFPTLEPGEIAVNTANRQIAIGDAASGTAGAPLPALALRFFDTRAQYAIGDMVYQNQIVYRAKVAISPGVFNPTQWDMLAGSTDPQYVLKAGDVMTGALSLPAANPTTGVHATHKNYVDTLVAAKSSIYASVSPPTGVADNSIWMETDTGVAYFRYNDGDSTQWMILSPQIDTSLFVLKTGDTMGGPLNLVTPPTAPTHAASKAYVDTRASVISSDTPPPSPIDNTLWYETDTGLFFIRFNDGTSAQWCAIAANAGDAVRYDAAQTLTSAQAAQARANIWVTKKNYVVNGGMQISQENGTTAVGANAGYGADQWLGVNGTGIVVATVQQRAVVTPGGSPNRLRLAVTTGGGAGSGNLGFQQKIEGFRSADLLYGSSGAKTTVLQFGWNSPAGTYSISVRNLNLDRTYLVSFTITAGQAGVDTLQTITIPGDVTGTWNTDFNYGLSITFSITVNAIGVPGWQAGSFGGLVTNTVPVGNFELFDVSLTEGAVAPPFQLPDYASELRQCQRYFYKRSYTGNTYVATLQAYSTVNASGVFFDFPVTMRAAPTATTTGAFNLVSAPGGALTVTGGNFITTPDALSVSACAVASGLVAGNAALYGSTGAASHILNARL